MPASPATASPAIRIMVPIQNAGASSGALARHTRPMTRAYPRDRERPEPARSSPILAHQWGLCHAIEKVLFLVDYKMYRLDHGLPVAAIRPRPIAAAAIAVQTVSKGAPLGRFSTVFSA